MSHYFPQGARRKREQDANSVDWKPIVKRERLIAGICRGVQCAVLWQLSYAVSVVRLTQSLLYPLHLLYATTGTYQWTNQIYVLTPLATTQNQSFQKHMTMTARPFTVTPLSRYP